MGKYTNLMEDLYEIISGVSTLKVYPDNFFKELEGDREYINLTIIPDSTGINNRSVNGICILDIHVKAGEGPRRYAEIADELDSYLMGKTQETSKGNVTQFFSSTLAPRGRVQEYPDTYKAEYTIQFKYFSKET